MLGLYLGQATTLVSCKELEEQDWLPGFLVNSPVTIAFNAKVVGFPNNPEATEVKYSLSVGHLFTQATGLGHKHIPEPSFLTQVGSPCMKQTTPTSASL